MSTSLPGCAWRRRRCVLAAALWVAGLVPVTPSQAAFANAAAPAAPASPASTSGIALQLTEVDGTPVRRAVAGGEGFFVAWPRSGADLPAIEADYRATSGTDAGGTDDADGRTLADDLLSFLLGDDANAFVLWVFGDTDLPPPGAGGINDAGSFAYLLGPGAPAAHAPDTVDLRGISASLLDPD